MKETKSEDSYKGISSDGRTLGEMIPLSIGTAIAFEKILTDPLLNEINSLYVNIKTIYRNVYGSFEKTPTKLEYGKVIKAFLSDIEELKQLNSKYIPNRIGIVLYFPKYSSLKRHFPHANIKHPSTPLQLERSRLENLAYEKLRETPKDIVEFDIKIDGKHTNALILTHYPVDLLSENTFLKLRLLESHTGAIKDRLKWISKLSDDDKCKNLPFNALTLQILGDSKLFGSLGKVFINALLELSIKGRWTTLTTKDRILYDISNMKDKFGASVFKEMTLTTIK